MIQWNETKKRCQATHDHQMDGPRSHMQSTWYRQGLPRGQNFRQSSRTRPHLERQTAERTRGRHAKGKELSKGAAMKSQERADTARSNTQPARHGAASGPSVSPCSLDPLVRQLLLLRQIYPHCCQRPACCGPCFSTNVLVEGLQNQRERLSQSTSFQLKHKYTYRHKVNTKVQDSSSRTDDNFSADFLICYLQLRKQTPEDLLEAKT